jgi:hypothetical protein
MKAELNEKVDRAVGHINDLLNRLPCIIWGRAVIRIPETGIDNAVLHVDEQQFFTEIPLLRHFQEPDEFLSPGGAWFDVFDLED